MRRDLTGARAIITGATSGIGLALARQLAPHHTKLLLTGRRAERLHSLAEEVQRLGSDPIVMAGDLTDPELQQRLVDTTLSAWEGLDLLFNNAGTGAVGPFAEAAPQRLRQIMEINFFAAAELIRLAVPALKRGNAPMVVNVGSVLGHRAVPMKSEYCASKFALHGLSDAIRGELWAERIEVLHVCPSTTSSEFFDALIEDGGQAPRRAGMSPEKVAEKILRATQRGKQEILISAGGKALVWIDRIWPSLANFLVRRLGQ